MSSTETSTAFHEASCTEFSFVPIESVPSDGAATLWTGSLGSAWELKPEEGAGLCAPAGTPSLPAGAPFPEEGGPHPVSRGCIEAGSPILCTCLPRAGLLSTQRLEGWAQPGEDSLLGGPRGIHGRGSDATTRCSHQDVADFLE